MAKAPMNEEVSRASNLAAELRTTLGPLLRNLRQYSEQQTLTTAQIAVIIRLEKEGPETLSGLARAERMRPPSMSAVIAPLEKMGYVTKAADPKDGRKMLLSLTKACKKAIEGERAARQDWLTQAIEQRLSPQEQKKVAAAVHLLARLNAP